ncbi:Uncharacterised protein [uncultured archaeon]|nr:Uncharacterised protein [uncultured archaeon]
MKPAAAIWAAATLFTAGCLGGGSESVWVSILPHGCLEAPWQQQWLLVNGINLSAYPGDRDYEIMRSYYGALFHPLNITVTNFSDAFLCGGGCSCPRGDRVWLLVPVENLSFVESEGFRQTSPEFLCGSDSDCVAVDDCCGCDRGGGRKAINKDYVGKWKEYLLCGQAPCPGVPLDEPGCRGAVRCVVNECVFVE